MTTEKSMALFSGVNHGPIQERLIKVFGRGISEEVLKDINLKTEVSYPDSLCLVPGIDLVLDFLGKNSIKKCIASNGDNDYIKKTLRITGLDTAFDESVIFGVQGQLKRKPSPDIFNHVANEMKLSPEQCLVIEDHALGIEAAKKANMTVVGFLGATHARNPSYEDWIKSAKPDHMAQDSEALLALLKSML